MSRVVTAILIVCADRCQVLRCLLATLTVCSLTSVFFPLVSINPSYSEIMKFNMPFVLGFFTSVVIPFALGMGSMFSPAILL